MTKVMKKDNAISKESFEQMKSIITGLQHEVDYDKAHHFDTMADSDFAGFGDPKVSGESLIQAINDNPDIIPATNLNVILNADEAVIMYADENYPYDSALDVEHILGIMQKLVKLGRHGIYARIQKNNQREAEINKLEAEMDL